MGQRQGVGVLRRRSPLRFADTRSTQGCGKHATCWLGRSVALPIPNLPDASSDELGWLFLVCKQPLHWDKHERLMRAELGHPGERWSSIRSIELPNIYTSERIGTAVVSSPLHIGSAQPISVTSTISVSSHRCLAVSKLPLCNERVETPSLSRHTRNSNLSLRYENRPSHLIGN